jgi:hypothetical protein
VIRPEFSGTSVLNFKWLASVPSLNHGIATTTASICNCAQIHNTRRRSFSISIIHTYHQTNRRLRGNNLEVTSMFLVVGKIVRPGFKHTGLHFPTIPPPPMPQGNLSKQQPHVHITSHETADPPPRCGLTPTPTFARQPFTRNPRVLSFISFLVISSPLTLAPPSALWFHFLTHPFQVPMTSLPHP